MTGRGKIVEQPGEKQMRQAHKDYAKADRVSRERADKEHINRMDSSKERQGLLDAHKKRYKDGKPRKHKGSRADYEFK